jgi:AmmeMemoRadiSam system protein B
MLAPNAISGIAMLEWPRLRPVDAFPVKQDGKTFIYLKDPLQLANPLGVTPAGYFIMSHFDGQHSFIDIQEKYSQQFGAVLLSDELRTFVQMLDQHYYLDTPRFLDHQKTVIEEFRRMPTRTPAHAGGVYKKDPDGLKTQLDGYFLSPKGPGLPQLSRGVAIPKAIVAPHIDFQRGGPAYAWAYKCLAESEGADLYILLGTSHCAGRTPFILTLKDFDTPLGLVETDKAFVTGLQEQCEQDLFADEYLHRGEHSLEFQVVFLKYIAQWRAQMRGESERPFQIVPILVSSFHPMVINRTVPEETMAVKTVLQALRRLTAAETRRVCFVAGVDLAHVGQQFGDSEPITTEFLKWVEAEDHKLVDRLLALDAPGFFSEIAKDQDKRKICGFSPLYSLIYLLDGARGNQLHYGQAFTPETGSAVTFTSTVFNETRSPKT